MKKIWGVIALLAMMLLSGMAQAQEYYTLPQLKEQAAKGWHEIYTDAYGRQTEVDIEIQVFGDENAPLLKVAFPEYVEFRLTHNNPYSTVSNVKAEGGSRTHIYRTFGEPVEFDESYGHSYGNDITLREMYDYLAELLDSAGIEAGDFVYEQPELFDVLCNVSQSTGDAITPAFYLVDLWPKLHDMPILTHAMGSFITQGWPDYDPHISFMMSDRDSYSLFVGTLLEKETVAADIPLCSLEQVIAGIEEEIKKGHIQRVYSLRFGYALYNDPLYQGNRSAYEADCFYAVPSWVLECAYMENPKDTFTYNYEEWIEKDSDTSERSMVGFRPMVINAQTGVMLDPLDTSKNGRSDADYKGVILWEDIK